MTGSIPERHTPERTCVACRRKRPQGELLRLTQQGEGWVIQQRQRTGRGVYVCADSPACWQEKPLRRAFRAQAGAVSELLKAQTPEPQPSPPATPPRP